MSMVFPTCIDSVLLLLFAISLKHWLCLYQILPLGIIKFREIGKIVNKTRTLATVHPGDAVSSLRALTFGGRVFYDRLDSHGWRLELLRNEFAYH